MTRPLLTAEEAAELLNVSKWWVRKEARANRIPHVPLGRNVRFDAEALEDWWRARLQGPVVPAYTDGNPQIVRGRGQNRPPHGPQEM